MIPISVFFGFFVFFSALDLVLNPSRHHGRKVEGVS